MFIGSPVLPQHLFEHGVAPTLDAMRELGAVNTVMTFSQNYVVRQYQPDFRPIALKSTGQPITDLFVRTDEKYYALTSLRQPRDPARLGADRDLLDELVDAARPRGMQVYARILEPYLITGVIPGLEACAEQRADGQPGSDVCFNHPDYVAFWDAVVTDLVESHPHLAGFKFGQERGGPLMKTIGGGTATCFCPHCTRLAEQRGIDVRAARAGLLALRQLVADHRQPPGTPYDPARRPIEGYHVAYTRLLAQHPTSLTWERFWMDSRENQRRRLYALIKRLRPEVQVGWHVDHGMSWDLVTRATWTYADMVPHSDWLSVALYFDCMGPRCFGHFQRNYQAFLSADVAPELAYAMYLTQLGYDPQAEAGYAQQLAAPTAFTTDYVYRETKRAVAAIRATGAKTQVQPRIGFDVPIKPTIDVSEADVYRATTLALQAGADGLWLGREWDELKPANAAAFGRAVRDWQKTRA